MRKFTNIQKFKAFLFSYSGFIATLGLLLFSGQIICTFIFDDTDISKKWQNTFSSISMSVVASVIFYFLTFYIPNVRKNKVEAKEIERYFRRLEDLNTYSLISLGLGARRLWKEGIFTYPTHLEIKKVSEGRSLQDSPYTECWKEDEIYDKLKVCQCWRDYFDVIVNEQLNILHIISQKINLHPLVREEVFRLKGNFSLKSFLDGALELEQLQLTEEQKKHYNKLYYLIISVCDHIKALVKIENMYYESIYNPF